MKSTIRIGLGVFVFIALVAITWAVSNNGLQAQPIEQSQPAGLTVQVSEPVSPADTSNLPVAPTVNPLNDKMVTSGVGISEQHAALPLPKAETNSISSNTDTVVQTAPGTINMPAPDANFEGVNNVDGVLPPDTDGEVGPNHYVQMVNLSTAIYAKDGTLLYGPFHPSDLWPSGDVCNTQNDGDPVVLYDQLSDRWLMTQFALPNYPNGPFYQCIAVSKTGVPTNVPADWYAYTFQVHSTKMNDYPKLGVWPDGYYMTANQFTSSGWAGAGVWAFDRTAMLTGSAATFQYFDLYNVNNNYGGMLPSDLDGTMLPPAGSPNYFVEVDDSSSIGPNDAMRIWEFHVDWTTPANTTFGLGAPGLPNATLATAPFDLLPCTTSGSRSCIPQSSSAQKLDSIGDRLMFRLAYRNFGDHESLVVNHTVWADGTDRAGVRWYEVRDPGGSPAIYQQGTYAPSDGTYRWMGSVAMDHNGNMAVGYSAASSTLDPSIRYAGRLAGDPLNTLPQAEETIIAGGGAQTHSAARWGDYSVMSVDPVDDCTFWFTTEYIQTTGSAPWQTRIASFKFPSCTAGNAGTLTGLIDDGSAGINGALVVAQGITATVQTTANSSGLYTMTLPVDTYTVTASAYGYFPSSVSSVGIISGTVTTQDLTLASAPVYTVTGTVTDVNTGWPLYASIDISGAGYPGSTIWTNPETGAYSVNLVGGITYNIDVNAWLDGYIAGSSSVNLTSNTTENFALDVDTTTCDAPGYEMSYFFVEDFETDDGGFTHGGTADEWAWGSPASWPNTCAEGTNCWGTDMSGNYEDNADNWMQSPVITLTGMSGITTTLAWQQAWNIESATYDHAYAEIRLDGGTWTEMWAHSGSTATEEWQKLSHTFVVSPSENIELRWRFTSDSSATYAGVYVDFIRVSDTCSPPADGGLLVGNIYDENTMIALNGAEITSDSGRTVTTFATPNDTSIDDGFFTIFSPSGSRVFTATMNGGYGADVSPLPIINGGTIAWWFHLPAGDLAFTPAGYDVTLEMGNSMTDTLMLSNNGNLAANFELLELDKGMVPLGPFETPEWVVKPFKSYDSDAHRVNRPQPTAAPFAAGDVIESWTVTQSSPWGIAYDAFSDSVWIGEGWGDNNVYEYTVDGTLTGASHPFSWAPANGPADIAYNWNTGMLWSLDVGGDNCIHEIDPASGVTGNTICPAFSTSQRGLAYDPSTDTYFAGGWNDNSIHRFDHTGAILSSVNVGLGISGLAYNPDTEHLFVAVSADPNPIFVLDVANSYALLGQFDVSSGFAAYSGAGLEFGADGSLWAVDQDTNTIYQFESGESSSLGASDILWLSENPITGTISALGNQDIELTFNAGAVTQPGVYHAQLKVNQDTPYAIPNIPITMTVTASATFGKLEGTVTGLGYCDANPSVLGNATVFLEDSAGMTTTLTTDSMGYYSLWVDQTSSPITVTVTASEYGSAMMTGITVTGQMTTTADFDLRWLQPCVDVSPQAVTVTMSANEVMTVPVTINNNGGAVTDFEIKELNGGFTASMLAPASGNILLMLDDVDTADWAAYRTALTAAGVTWTELDLDTETFPTLAELSAYDILIWGDEGTLTPGDAECQVVVDWLNSGDKAFFATSVDFLWDLENGTVGQGEHNLYLMLNTTYTGDYAGSGIATLDGVAGDVIGGGLTLQLAQSSGDYADETTGAPTGMLYGTGGDGSGHSALTHYEGANYKTVWLGINFHNGLAVQAERNTLMSNILNFLDVDNDMPWLSESPITGTIGIDGSANITLRFDSTVITQSGTYTGVLKVMSNDPVNGVVEIPISMYATANHYIYLPAVMKP